MMGEGRIHTKGKKVGHCRVSQRLLSMIVALYVPLFFWYFIFPLQNAAHIQIITRVYSK